MKHWLKDNRGFLVFVLCLGFFRTAVADWNPVPSGSMRPTILEGDVVLVNRLAYDFKLPLTDLSVARLGEPARGDIVVFHSPRDGVRLIKRLVALPGDTVQMEGGQLHINGQPLAYSELQAVVESPAEGHRVAATRGFEGLPGRRHAVQFFDEHGHGRDFGPFVVPAGHYFMLGDNRDNSEDSRYIGPVPRHLLVGRADRTLVSADILGDWHPRFERFGARMP